MWRVTVLLLAIVLVCSGASVPEEAQRNQRFFGTLNSYHILTWDRLSDGTGVTEVKNTEEGVAALDFLNANATQNVAIVVHGREDSAFSEFGHTIRTYLLERDRTMAVILLDWSTVSRLSYDMAITTLPSVAEDLADFIALLVSEEKIDTELLHLIGFDLGAHIVGMANRLSTDRAKKITGLDPAGQSWDSFSRRLTSSDAQTVEVIHTDGVGTRAYGIGEAIGTLDFFPNGGTRQPGCANSNNLCHHNRAWQLFAATVDMDGHLFGFRCGSMTEMSNNRCVGFPTATMGTNELVKSATGIYRVNTGRTYPYSA